MVSVIRVQEYPPIVKGFYAGDFLKSKNIHFNIEYIFIKNVQLLESVEYCMNYDIKRGKIYEVIVFDLVGNTIEKTMDIKEIRSNYLYINNPSEDIIKASLIS